MKLASAAVALISMATMANAECSDYLEYSINTATKLSFSGFLPNVKRYESGFGFWILNSTL